MEKTKFTASKKKKRKPQPNEDLRLASKSNSTVYRAWVGKAETRQPGRYKLNRTFCHLILGLQFFFPQEHPLSELSYDIKILSQFLTHAYALKQIDGVDAKHGV